LMHRTMAHLVDRPPALVDGYLEVPARPGLGIDLREDLLGRYVDWGEERSAET